MINLFYRSLETVKHLIKPGRLSRRKFLGAFFLTSLSFLLNPFTFTHASKKEGSIKTGSSSRSIKGEFRFFTPYQATLMDEVASLIIPSDEHPGAREAGVVYEMDKLLAASNKKRGIYIKWMRWLDAASEYIYGKKSFLDLKEDEKIDVLKAAESGRLPHVKKTNVPGKRPGMRTARKSFRMVSRLVFELFYTSRAGWEITGYGGPPQWSGNRDYHRCS